MAFVLGSWGNRKRGPLRRKLGYLVGGGELECGGVRRAQGIEERDW